MLNKFKKGSDVTSEASLRSSVAADVSPMPRERETNESVATSPIEIGGGGINMGSFKMSDRHLNVDTSRNINFSNAAGLKRRSSGFDSTTPPRAIAPTNIFSKNEVLNLLKQLRAEIMKETRRIYKSEFDLLMDKYRQQYGEEDRENMVEYLDGNKGYSDIGKLPRLLERVSELEKNQ